MVKFSSVVQILIQIVANLEDMFTRNYSSCVEIVLYTTQLYRTWGQKKFKNKQEAVNKSWPVRVPRFFLFTTTWFVYAIRCRKLDLWNSNSCFQIIKFMFCCPATTLLFSNFKIITSEKVPNMTAWQKPAAEYFNVVLATD